jgi:hypothetical protein
LCCCGGLKLRGLYVYWFVFTPEDREFLRNDGRVYGGGVPSVARRLKAEMESIPDPETAARLHPDWVVTRCENREWLFGYGIDSHPGLHIGHGTLVVKDSRGKVWIFFGHVCGENGPLWFGNSLDEMPLDWYLSRLKDNPSLREWNPGP